MMTQIAGIKIGHYTDLKAATGCTVVLCEEGAVGGVDVRGSAPGARSVETAIAVIIRISFICILRLHYLNSLFMIT